MSRFHQTQWKPGSSALVFVGDITLAEATALAKQHFSGWSGGAAPAVTVPAPQPVGPGKVYLIDRQNAAQTVIAHVLPAPARAAADYAAVTLADAVYGGGGFGTRLNLNLREDKGYSYGVFSNAALLRQAGAIIASGGVQTDKTKESAAEFITELKNLAGAKPITQAELDAARLTKIRGYSQQFESLDRVSRPDRQSLGGGAADDRAAARAGEPARGFARRGQCRRREVRGAGRHDPAAGRRSLEDRGRCARARTPGKSSCSTSRGGG